MRKGNVTILASIFMMLLVAMGVGAGTMAYFSDVESATGNQITAGVLNIKIKDSDEDFKNGPVTASLSSPPLKPGEEFWTDVIQLRNDGTIDAQYVYAHFRDLTVEDGAHPESEWDDKPNYLMHQIVLVEIWEWAPLMEGVGGECYTTFDSATANAWLNYWGAPEDNSISLYDIVTYAEPGGASAKTSFRFHTGDVTDPGGSGLPCHKVYPYLPVGKVVKIAFKFKLLEDTLNYAQGDICRFNVDFIATNALDGADVDASF